LTALIQFDSKRLHSSSLSPTWQDREKPIRTFHYILEKFTELKPYLLLEHQWQTLKGKQEWLKRLLFQIVNKVKSYLEINNTLKT
jgi:hypothetical protein